MHGQNRDSICDLCRISNCDDRNLADSDNFKGRHSSGAILQTTGLEIGKVYTTDEFLEKVRKLYPHKIPKR